MRKVFTTKQVSALCNISQQTIIRCFDEGHLRGFRIPGSSHRRIPRAALVEFMRANGIDVPEELAPPASLAAPAA